MTVGAQIAPHCDAEPSADFVHNLATDVQIAAHAIERNGEVHSNDTDFGRFEGLHWVNPLSA